MIGAVENGDVLRVAHPNACTAQQTGKNDATGCATTIQPASLKALAQLPLTRSNVYRNRQGNSPKVTQQTGIAAEVFVAQELDMMRARLLELAPAELIDAASIRLLLESDLANCVAQIWSDRQCVTFLHLMTDTAKRHAGRVPEADTGAAYCQHCGPVCVHSDIAAVLPMVGGWPRALGCQWCFGRRSGAIIPPPSVTCTQCQHFTRDKINPKTGMGTCCDGSARYPTVSHRCASFQPEEAP